ncbi:MAG TPA: hypothetical protein PLV07_09200 [Acidiphilium sp.]|uniref:MotE family protein n=1 Tax=unclassified Acidiphilium TaxID=2617493 RepID=UPI0025BC03B2|nr:MULTISPECIES: hypothetical protein [unclassified Acidiphilium]HQT62492.1 hypothetical protein [Acidiphilium sp.]HQU11744.1 hypothetical protein [Acidiphilium sp.]
MPPDEFKSRGLPRLLPIVTFCLCGTILFKSAGLVDAAFAGTSTSGKTSAGLQQAQAKPSGTTSASSAPSAYEPVANWKDKPPPPPLCKPDPLDQTGERKVLLQLKQRAEQLDERAAALNRQKSELAVEKEAIAKQIAAIKPLAQKLEQISTAQKAADEKKWAALVSTYETMDPRSAARIFDGLDPKIVLNVIQRMSSRKSAPILAAMSPQKAQIVTEKLAGMSAMTPKPQPVASLLPDGAP